MIDKEALSKYRYVFVTGCQRSGTQFVAQVIQYELGCDRVVERDFAVYDIGMLFRLLEKKDKVVIHGPVLSSYLDFMVSQKLIDSRDAIVWVKRNKQDVFNSMKKIDWNDLAERTLYFPYLHDPNLDIYEIKNRYWETQKENLRKAKIDYLEVQYEDLSNHVLWIPPGSDERRNL